MDDDSDLEEAMLGTDVGGDVQVTFILLVEVLLLVLRAGGAVPSGSSFYTVIFIVM